MRNTNYHFIPALRRGLVANIKEPSTSERSHLNVNVIVNARKKNTTEFERNIVSKSVHLYGPGDILGFNASVISRVEPKADTGNFEPNYFPFIEFNEPDFLWRFSALNATSDGRLTPWISLIVLKIGDENNQSEFQDKAIGNLNQKLPPYIEVNSEALPDLTHAWRWAHVQVTGEDQIDHYEKLVENNREQVVARLMCPRFLKAKTRYCAFVVPTFLLGVKAGLGEDTNGGNATELAWDKNASPSTIRLPYYYHWEFNTALKGDFEYLVRLLEAKKLEGLGKREMDCSKVGYALPSISPESGEGLDKKQLELEGALQSLDVEPTSWGKDVEPLSYPTAFQLELANLLNKSGQGLKANEFIAILPNFDINDPVIFTGNKPSIQADGISVTINWETKSEFLTKKFIYYTDDDRKYEFLWHWNDIVLTELIPGKTYYFKVIVERTINNESITFDSRLGSFTMPSLPSIVPPVYGLWHRARALTQQSETVTPNHQEEWLDVLNLDPRHRAAAGFGVEVVRKQQEGLMTSAWEQIGEIESTNDILRRAQFGRQISNNLHRRLNFFSVENYLRITTNVQKHILIEDDNGKKVTVSKHLAKCPRIPQGLYDSAFRRIYRKDGSIRKRQKGNGGGNIFARLLSNKKDRMEIFSPELELGGLMTACMLSHELTREIGKLATTYPSELKILEIDSVDKSINVNKLRDIPKKLSPKDYFCEENINCQIIPAKFLNKENFFPLNIFKTDICPIFDGWLNSPSVSPSQPETACYNLDTVKNHLQLTLTPGITILDRTKARLRGKFIDRFTSELNFFVDEFDEVMAAPEFPQPMYESLRDISQDLLLPGIEKISQNTIGLLKSNRRFMESYLCGCNHEFASELLWRRYPTDQRGTYFRQFWDVSEYIPQPNEINESGELTDITLEKLKDINKMHLWRRNRLGNNYSISGFHQSNDNLVLVIRGNLLNQYPNTLIYAIEATEIFVENNKKKVPLLYEYMFFKDREGNQMEIKDVDGNVINIENLLAQVKPIYPIFKATLKPDITFLGFPISVQKAKGSNTSEEDQGVYFIFEERVSENRFGLDVSGNASLNRNWNNLAWHHFGYSDLQQEGYLDNGIIDNDLNNLIKADLDDSTMTWDNISSAYRAKITLQKPMRVAIHARQMIPVTE